MAKANSKTAMTINLLLMLLLLLIFSGAQCRLIESKFLFGEFMRNLKKVIDFLLLISLIYVCNLIYNIVTYCLILLIICSIYIDFCVSNIWYERRKREDKIQPALWYHLRSNRRRCVLWGSTDVQLDLHWILWFQQA